MRLNDRKACPRNRTMQSTSMVLSGMADGMVLDHSHVPFAYIVLWQDSPAAWVSSDLGYGARASVLAAISWCHRCGMGVVHRAIR